MVLGTAVLAAVLVAALVALGDDAPDDIDGAPTTSTTEAQPFPDTDYVVGQAFRGCGEMIMSLASARDRRAGGSCWILNPGPQCCTQVYFVSGESPREPGRGLLAVLQDFELGFETFLLEPGSGTAYIYELSAEAVCMETGNGVRAAFDLAGRRLVPLAEAPACPEPPRYTPGEAFRVDCDDTQSSGVYLNRKHDCWALATGEHDRELAWVIGGRPPSTTHTNGFITFVGGPSNREVGAVVPGGDVTIYDVTPEFACFSTPRDGPEAFDLGSGQLVDVGRSNCPTPSRRVLERESAE